MIIECGHCGAPLDVKQGAETSKCQYCDTVSRVQQLRTVAPQTPKGWKPPRQWVPPAHARADSNQTLTYHAVAAARGAVRMVVGLVTTLLLVAAGGVAVYVFSMNRSAMEATKELSQAAVGAGVQAQVADAMKQVNRALGDAKLAQRNAGVLAPQTSLLTAVGVTEALAGYKAALGVPALNLQQLVLHEEHSSIGAQSAKNPAEVDSYRYRRGQVTGPEPVRLSAREKKTLKASLFNPEKTALLKIDELKTVALGKLAYEETKISHVIVDRSRGKIGIRIYGRSPRESGYVLFDADGKVVRVYR